MWPNDLLKPDNLLYTVAAFVGLVLGSAIVYVRKNLLTPAQTKTTDLIVAGGSIVDMAEFKRFREDVTRIAVALEELARLRREQSREEEMEDKIRNLLGELLKKNGN